jgi:hypothetical protein
VVVGVTFQVAIGVHVLGWIFAAHKTCHCIFASRGYLFWVRHQKILARAKRDPCINLAVAK